MSSKSLTWEKQNKRKEKKEKEGQKDKGQRTYRKNKNGKYPCCSHLNCPFMLNFTPNSPENIYEQEGKEREREKRGEKERGGGEGRKKPVSVDHNITKKNKPSWFYPCAHNFY